MNPPLQHSFGTIAPSALASLLNGDEPFALFDVRDEGVFARGHLLFACSLPLGDLEVRLPRLVPHEGLRIVLTSDAGDGQSERAAARCMASGYLNVQLVEGGNAACEAAGFTMFRGIHVPSKAFGELVESHYHTPMIEPAALHALMKEGADVQVFDSRPPHEFHRMNLPGARNCPGGDLLARIPAQVSDPATLVVINCAGRTRSIIGAQSLINAGFQNQVVALKNGTMGWHLAGFELEHGGAALVSAVEGTALEAERAMATNLRERFGVATIGMEELHMLQLNAATQSPMLFDVRGPWEYEGGHLEGSRSAPGGQLVQATDLYLAVRNAPVVLIDDDGIRASVTASWLVQLGLPRVMVLDHREALPLLTREGPFEPLPAERIPPVQRTTVEQLARELEHGRAIVIDVGRSDTFYKQHIPGARFAIRSRFASSLPALAKADHLVVVAEDDSVAAFAAAEAATLSDAPVSILLGGTAAWASAGLPTANGLEGSIDPPEDMWHIPSSPLGGREAAMRDYISWEIDLATQVLREPGVRFRVGVPSPSPRP